MVRISLLPRAVPASSNSRRWGTVFTVVWLDCSCIIVNSWLGGSRLRHSVVGEERQDPSETDDVVPPSYDSAASRSGHPGRLHPNAILMPLPHQAIPKSRCERTRWSTGKIDKSGGPSYSEPRDRSLSKEPLSDVLSDSTGPVKLLWRRFASGQRTCCTFNLMIRSNGGMLKAVTTCR
jgi:hypothetical protein